MPAATAPAAAPPPGAKSSDPLATPQMAETAANAGGCASPDLLSTPNLQMLSRFLDAAPAAADEPLEPPAKVARTAPARKEGGSSLGKFDALAGKARP